MGTATARWWKESDPHQGFLAAFRRVRTCSASTTRDRELLRSVRLYEGRRCTGLGPDSYSVIDDDEEDPKPINVVRAGVDTVHAEICQSKPRPMALTKGGDFAAQKKAKLYTKLAEACLYDSGGDEEAAQCLRDCIALGSGVAKIWDFQGRVRVARVMLHQLFVDPVEAYQGKPRTLYYVDQIDRAVLCELFPKHEAFIENAGPITGSGAAGLEFLIDFMSDGQGYTADVVEVVESWRLPSSKAAKDGRHIIATSRGVLLDEPWEDESFPFAFMHFGKPLFGLWGQGAGQRLRGIQKRLDTLDDTIERTLWLLANARVMVPRSANIELSHMQSNEIGAVIEYDGTQAPQIQTFQAVPPELYQQREFWVQKGFEELGVSQMQATSQKPAGLNSGVSIRYYADIQSKRFVELAQAYQEFYVEIARQSIRCARRIANDNNGFTVVYKSKTTVETITVKDLDIDEESFVLQVFPISMLPGTPAGKLAALQELMQAGVISQETFYRLADFPDLDAERELRTAPRDLVDKTLDYMLETGDYVQPEPMQDLTIALSVSVLRYQRCRIDGTQEAELELLRRYMADAQALMKPPPPPMPAAPAAAAMPIDPNAAPMPGAPMPQGIAA